VDARIESSLERVRKVLDEATKKPMTDLIEAVRDRAVQVARPRRYGRVVRMVGMSIEVVGIGLAIGDGCLLLREGEDPVLPRSSP